MDKLAHYSKQSIVHPWPYDIHVGDDSTISIPASGDIMHTAHLKITWPSNAPSLTAPATALIDFMELIYDGEVIERVYGENMYINNDLDVPTQKQSGLSNLIGPSMTTFYIQLPFTILDTGLPLCALDQQPKLRVVFNKRASTYTKPIKTELLIEYVYIPKKEIDYMKTHTLTYSTRSYQRLQFIVPVGTSNVSVLSEFVNDVSELYWVVQNTSADGVYDYGGRDSVRSIRLALNGSDVLVPEIGTGQYLRVVQALQHHARVPSNYYYMYSFVCPVNMSRVLRQQHTINLVENGYERRLTLYAKSLNEFRVEHGIGHMRDKMRESGSLVSRSVGSGYNIVSTVAGTAGISLPDSSLISPTGIVYDGNGNMFFCGSSIRKLVIATGQVTIVASLGGSGVAYDGQGNLYISDSSGHTILKIVIASGQVTTIAGLAGSNGSADGFGSAARFSGPTGIVYDGQGNLYICDSFNSTIRKLVIATGAVSTIASGFNYQNGITYDGQGNLFICDTYNNTIRQLVIATGAVSTIAGLSGPTVGSADGVGSAARFNYPQGITYDGQGNLFICDTFNHTIRKLVIATQTVSTIAGLVVSYGSADGFGSGARFFYPQGLTYDGQGNLFICDKSNNAVRKLVISSQAVITVVGNSGSPDGIGSAARFNAPYGVAYDGQGNLYICDSFNSTIRKLVIATQKVSTIAGLAGSNGSADGFGSNARFNQPYGVAYDGQGNLYICDTGNNIIRKLMIATGAVTTIAGTAGLSGTNDGVGLNAKFSGPWGITYDGQGNLFICDYYSTVIRKLVIATQAVTTVAGSAYQYGIDDGVGSAARFYGPMGLTYDGKGNIFICEYLRSTIRQFVIATSQVTTVAGLAGSPGSADGSGSAARFNRPTGVAYDGSGNLFICEYNNSTIRKLVIATQTVTTIASGFNQPQGIVYDGKGNLFICNTSSHTIRKIIL